MLSLCREHGANIQYADDTELRICELTEYFFCFN